MANGQASLSDTGFGKTMRRDAWWVQPLLTFLGLSAFIVYSTWRAFYGQYFLAVEGEPTTCRRSFRRSFTSMICRDCPPI